MQRDLIKNMIINIDEEQRLHVKSDDYGISINVEYWCYHHDRSLLTVCDRCQDGWLRDHEAGIYIPSGKLNALISGLRAFNVLK
jgi:hypothetical protein